MLWLAVRFPYLALDSVQKKTLPPSATEAEIISCYVVCEKSDVIQASSLAIDKGIKPGMKVASARVLCENLKVFERDPAAERNALKKLAGSLLFISPTVCITSPNTVAIEISGCLKLFSGLINILNALKNSLGRTPYLWLYGLGHTPLCASILATRTESDTGHHDGIDLHDSQMNKAHFMAQLEHIPIKDLPLESKIKSSLQAPGFRSLKDIFSIPPHALGRRQGSAFLDWLQRLTGDKPDPQTPITIPPRFNLDIEFPEPVSNTDALLFSAKRLLSELHYFLQKNQKSTKAIRWHFTDAQKNTHRIIIRRSNDDTNPAAWQDLTRRHFDQLALPAATLKLSLECARMQRSTANNSTLFSDAPQRADIRQLVDRLMTLPLLQLETIKEGSSHLLDTGKSERKLNIHEIKPKSITQEQEDDSTLRQFFDAPLWLIDQPKRLQEHNKCLYLRGEKLECLPTEQIVSEQWWEKSTTRHYRVARNLEGLTCWVFFDPTKEQWYLHGFF